MGIFAKRVDANHTEIMRAARSAGCSVQDVSMVPHFVDLIVAKHGVNYLVEIKTETGKLKPHQSELQESWRGPIHVVRSIDDIIDLTNAKR